MAVAELSFDADSGASTTLSVRKFSIREAMSSLFEVTVEALSADPNIDLETKSGDCASFHLNSGVKYVDGGRTWAGVVRAIRQRQSETAGLSTYDVMIAPRLWLLTQRRGHRIFQHHRIPDIIDALLEPWGVARDWQIGEASYPRLELRTQYGESDYAFFARLLEEAGISFYFEHREDEGTVVVLSDRPQGAADRETGPITYADNPSASAEMEYVTKVALTQEVRPGMVVLRDSDFRRAPNQVLLGIAQADAPREVALQDYRYAPGAFLVELESGGPALASGVGAIPLHGAWGTGVNLFATEIAGALRGSEVARGVATSMLTGNVPEATQAALKGAVDKGTKLLGKRLGGLTQDRALRALGKLGAAGAGPGAKWLAKFAAKKLFGDDRGTSRHLEEHGSDRAALLLESLRAGRRRLTFETNVVGLSPGTSLQIDHHPRFDLSSDDRLLVLALHIEGSVNAEWVMNGEAVYASAAFRPALLTPKPVVSGVQSALVTGPPGEEIHTDETGRVRVQFHWDRQSQGDDRSSCWLRVSQGWAGGRYGMIALPRVGHEVLVAFLEGDPDQPIVVGRLYNETAKPPYDLPFEKTRSGWRTLSTPGGLGYNELMFEDGAGRELVRMHAQRNSESVVEQDESISVGHDQTVSVSNDRTTQIGAVDKATIGVERRTTMTQLSPGSLPPTELVMIDRRIELTTGEASIVLEGPNITLQAQGVIKVLSTGNDVVIQGGPWVKINCGEAKEGESDTVTSHHVTGMVYDQDGAPLAGYRVIVKGSDGAIQQVQTDSSGRYLALIADGPCEVSVSGGVPFGAQDTNLDHMGTEAIEAEDCGPVV